jgi:hypothetical protein
LPLVEGWEASDDRWRFLSFSDVAAILKVTGWILVPLGVAGVAGALRSKPVGAEE